jgi:ring-1,2-phenylacetyl-CoA epoxidase subunit PaaE
MTVTITRPQRRRPAFHELRVAAVDPLTDDAVAVCFGVPAELRSAFAFQPGQHLTVRRRTGDEDVRRSYSICSTPADLAAKGVLRIGVRLVEGGAFSGFALRELRAGHTVEVLPPLGHFTTALDPARERHYAAVVAGSGITPVLSLVATALSVEPTSRFTVLYGNRTAATVMFAEELGDLKDRYPDRLHLVHVLSREAQGADLLSGRLDADRLGRIFGDVGLVAVDDVDEWFLCGPYGMVLDARQALAARGVDESTVRTELFHVEEAPAAPRPRTAVDRPGATVTVRLDGRTSEITVAPDERILDAALRSRPELPYACKGGVCSTCRARLVEGKVEMARNFALEDDELAAGYILTCQATPVTDRLVIDYDG